LDGSIATICARLPFRHQQSSKIPVPKPTSRTLAAISDFREIHQWASQQVAPPAHESYVRLGVSDVEQVCNLRPIVNRPAEAFEK